MIEIVEVKEARYNSVDEVPIEKYKVMRNKKYCQNIQKSYEKIRKEFHEQWKENSKENESSEWKEIVRIFDKNFINAFLCIWKENVFEKSINFSRDELGLEKEKQLIEEALEDGKIQEKVKQFFLENIPVIQLMIKQSESS